MTYVYRCPKCESQKEMEQSITDDYRPLCTCQHERPVTMERVIFPATVVLKGGGWAKDGYR